MYKNYINGKCVEGAGKEFKVFNPATNELLTTTRGVDGAQIKEALEGAEAAFKIWSRTSLNDRIKWMKKLCGAMNEHKERFIELLAGEVGKSFSEGKLDFESFHTSMDFYAEEAKRIYGTSVTDWTSTRGDLFHVMELRPIGVQVAHLSWNWPIQAIGHKLSPTLASGCTIVLKPSIKTPLSAMLLGEVAESINFPKGVLNIVTGDSSFVAKELNQSRIPRIVSLIGSAETGRTIVNQAGTSIKHFSFELGGNAPAIIMPDADIEEAVKMIVERKKQNCGQGCATPNRIFVHKSIHDKVVGLLVEQMKKVQVGWGRETPTAMGPVIDKEARDALLGLIKETVDAGATIAYGGVIPSDLPANLKDGSFLMPTILDNVRDDMRITQQEIFGPVLPVLTFGDDLDELLERCNRTDYGLTAYLFAYDSRVISKVLEDLEVGEVFVNMTVRGVFLPHVGIKESGIGCTNSKWALEEYYHLKRYSVCTNKTASNPYPLS